MNNGAFCLTLSDGSGTVVLGWGGTSISASLTANVNYTLSFSISSADPQAGLAFQLAASSGSPTVCVDNVTLTAN